MHTIPGFVQLTAISFIQLNFQNINKAQQNILEVPENTEKSAGVTTSSEEQISIHQIIHRDPTVKELIFFITS